MDRSTSNRQSYAFKPLVPLKLDFSPPEVEPPSLFERMMSFVSSVCSKLGNSMKKAPLIGNQPRNTERKALKALLRQEAKIEDEIQEQQSDRLLKVRKMAEVDLQNRSSQPSSFKKSLKSFRTLDIQILNEMQLDDSQQPYRKKKKRVRPAPKPDPQAIYKKEEHSRMGSNLARSSYGSIVNLETKEDTSASKKSTNRSENNPHIAQRSVQKFLTPEPTEQAKAKAEITPKSLEFSFAAPKLRSEQTIKERVGISPKFQSLSKLAVQEEEKERKNEKENKNDEVVSMKEVDVQEGRAIQDTKNIGQKDQRQRVENQEEKEKDEPKAKSGPSPFSAVGKKAKSSIFGKGDIEIERELKTNPLKLGKFQPNKREDDTVLTQDEDDCDVKMKDAGKIESPIEEKSVFQRNRFNFSQGWNRSTNKNIFGAIIQSEKNRSLGADDQVSHSLFGKGHYNQQISALEQSLPTPETPSRSSFQSLRNPFAKKEQQTAQQPQQNQYSFASSFGFKSERKQNPFQTIRSRQENRMFEAPQMAPFRKQNSFFNYQTSTYATCPMGSNEEEDLFGETSKRYKHA